MMSVKPPPSDTGTRLAIDRTRLALRANDDGVDQDGGVALISFGFTIYKFFQLELKGEQREGLIGSRGFALLMISTGLISLLLAGYQHSQSLKMLREHKRSTDPLGRRPGRLVHGRSWHLRAPRRHHPRLSGAFAVGELPRCARRRPSHLRIPFHRGTGLSSESQS